MFHYNGDRVTFLGLDATLEFVICRTSKVRDTLGSCWVHGVLNMDKARKSRGCWPNRTKIVVQLVEDLVLGKALLYWRDINESMVMRPLYTEGDFAFFTFGVRIFRDAPWSLHISWELAFVEAVVYENLWDVNYQSRIEHFSFFLLEYAFPGSNWHKDSVVWSVSGFEPGCAWLHTEETP